MLSGKNLLIGGIVLLIVISIPFGVYLVQERTRLELEAEPLAPGGVPQPTPFLRKTPAEGFGDLMESSFSLQDYSEFVASFGKPNLKFDFNENGVVDADDFAVFKQRYGK